MIRPLSLALLLAAALPSHAQEPPAARRERAPSRGDAFKMVDAYIVSNLQESLELSDEQFVKLLPHVKRLQKDRRDLAQRRRHAITEMHRLLEEGSATEARLGELMAELRKVEEEEGPTIRKDLDALDAVLTPVQQAKYRVLESKIEQKIRELMGHVRQERMQDRALREPRSATPSPH